MRSGDRSLARVSILTGLTTASRARLMKRRAALQERIKDMEHFFPDWPALAQSFEEDVRMIDERLEKMGKP